MQSASKLPSVIQHQFRSVGPESGYGRRIQDTQDSLNLQISLQNAGFFGAASQDQAAGGARAVSPGPKRRAGSRVRRPMPGASRCAARRTRRVPRSRRRCVQSLGLAHVGERALGAREWHRRGAEESSTSLIMWPSEQRREVVRAHRLLLEREHPRSGRSAVHHRHQRVEVDAAAWPAISPSATVTALLTATELLMTLIA